MPIIQVEVMKLTQEATIPELQHKGDSGYDLFSIENVTIHPFERILVSTGLAFAIPYGYEGCIRPRSGNTIKKGYTVLNSPGTIDSNYRGEVKVILYNTTNKPIRIRQFDRIAQIVFQKLPTIDIVEVKNLDNTIRGAGGFGSTGD